MTHEMKTEGHVLMHGVFIFEVACLRWCKSRPVENVRICFAILCVRQASCNLPIISNLCCGMPLVLGSQRQMPVH
jgi:hypothetical protein